MWFEIKMVLTTVSIMIVTSSVWSRLVWFLYYLSQFGFNEQIFEIKLVLTTVSITIATNVVRLRLN